MHLGWGWPCWRAAGVKAAVLLPTAAPPSPADQLTWLGSAVTASAVLRLWQHFTSAQCPDGGP